MLTRLFQTHSLPHLAGFRRYTVNFSSFPAFAGHVLYICRPCPVIVPPLSSYCLKHTLYKGESALLECKTKKGITGLIPAHFYFQAKAHFCRQVPARNTRDWLLWKNYGRTAGSNIRWSVKCRTWPSGSYIIRKAGSSVPLCRNCRPGLPGCINAAYLF